MDISFFITKSYVFSLIFLGLSRSFTDGITFFNININIDWFKADHNPKFTLQLTFFNINIISIEIYNIRHIDDIDTDNIYSIY